MREHPDRQEGQQEMEVSGASAEEQTPQSLEGANTRASAVAKANEQASAIELPKHTKAEKQEFYWRRQAEKLEKELSALRVEREAEFNRLARDRDEAVAKAMEAEWEAERITLISESGLPSELYELVPQGPPETVAAYVEKLKPIAEKLSRPIPRGLTNTNPPNPAGGDEARLSRLASEAARGDRRALREYAHLRERARVGK